MALRTNRLVVFVVTGVAALAAAPIVSAQIILTGSTYNVGGTNFPTSFSAQTVTLDQTPKLINGGQLRITETIYPTSDGGAWLDLYFERVSGGPLAGNLNGAWDFFVNHLLMNQPAVFNGAYKYWAVNGAAVNPIVPFGGFAPVAPHPVNPSFGPTYVSAPSFGPLTQFDFTTLTFISPYSFISSGGMNPSTVNGFHHGFHFSPVPEPGSLTLLSLGGIGLLGWIRRGGPEVRGGSFERPACV